MTSRLLPPTNPELLEKICKMRTKMDRMVLRTPTGPVRDALTDVNLMLMQAEMCLTILIRESST